MKKIILLLMCAFLASIGSAQDDLRRLAPNERDPFFQNPEVKLLIDNFKKQDYVSGAFENEGTIRFKAKEGQATTDRAPATVADMSLLTYTVTNANTRKTVDIVMFKNNNSNEAKVWAENESTIFTLSNRSITENPNTASANATRGSLSNCWQQYGIAAISNGSNCVNCVYSCRNLNRKWKRIYCALTKCGGSCASSIGNFYGFVMCIFN